jgi:hypothetical protein
MIYPTFFSFKGCNDSRNGFMTETEGYTKVIHEINKIVERWASELA